MKPIEEPKESWEEDCRNFFYETGDWSGRTLGVVEYIRYIQNLLKSQKCGHKKVNYDCKCWFEGYRMGEVEAGYKVRKDEREDIKKKIERMKTELGNQYFKAVDLPFDENTFEHGVNEGLSQGITRLSNIIKIL